MSGGRHINALYLFLEGWIKFSLFDLLIDSQLFLSLCRFLILSNRLTMTTMTRIKMEFELGDECFHTSVG